VTPETVRAVMTERTKAVIVVHLFGNVAPVAEIEALGVPVLEDAAQAAGSTSVAGRPGALGTIATFSFYPSKNLGAMGDGGAITCRDAALAERVRTLRFHGSEDKVDYVDIGYNSRLDELQAAILRVQLPQLDRWAAARATAGDAYAAQLAELVTIPVPTPGARPAWHLYVIRHSAADALAASLSAAGIGCRAYYRTPVHAQPPMAPFAPRVPLPGTEEAARTHLAIPMSAALREEQVGEVVAAVRTAVSAAAA
jgi:dTDP-3-amino-3,4,6-trideoxy-alpha-D-glucose transaminase